MLRCPRWILRQLIEARQSQSRTLEMQIQIQDELNQYKVKANTAEQTTREKYQQEAQQKDEQIRKLNLQLKELYKDVGNKGPQVGTQFKSVEVRVWMVLNVHKFTIDISTKIGKIGQIGRGCRTQRRGD
jgi:prophage DNA circulation protein